MPIAKPASASSCTSTPKGIIESLDLRRPIYRETARHGHFGRELPNFSWEKTDKAAALKKEVGVAAVA